jgi:hypothetical protein
VGGTVIQAGPGSDGWGISVKIRDADGIIHNYGHLSGVNVSVGDTVSAGQSIALSGNSGASTGPHLSYDVLGPDGRALDPSPYLGFNAVGDNRTSSLIGADVSDLGSVATSSGGGSSKVEDTQYWEKRRRFNQLTAEYGLWLDNPDLARQLKIPQPSPEIVQEMLALDGELADYEDNYQAGNSPSEIRSAYDFWNSTDPRAIDAENAANKYAAEVQKRQDAASLAGDLLSNQQKMLAEATDSQQKFIDSAAGGAPRLGFATAMPAKVKSGEELFAESLQRVSEGLPDLPSKPYPMRPNSLDSILSAGKKRPPQPPQVLQPGVAYGGNTGSPMPRGLVDSGGIEQDTGPRRLAYARPTSSALGANNAIEGSILSTTGAAPAGVDVTLTSSSRRRAPFQNIAVNGLSDLARTRWQTSFSR